MDINVSTQKEPTQNIHLNKATQQNNINVNSLLFQDILNSDKVPEEITYQEYKNITKDELEKLYPKETMPNKNAKAISLYTRADGSSDEVLNKVLFDKELNTYYSKSNSDTSKIIDSILNLWESLEKFELTLQKTEEYIKNNNITFPKNNFLGSLAIFSKIDSKIYEETVVPVNKKKISAEDLFKVFENNKIGAESIVSWNNYKPKSVEYEYYQEMIRYEESIIFAYQKELDKNNSMLDS